MKKLKLEITIRNNGVSLDFNNSDLNEISEINSDIDLEFKSIQSPERMSKPVAHYSLESSIILLVSGLTISGILKTFLESLIKDAGKDFWSLLKKTIKSLWKKQNDIVYRNKGVTFLMFRFGSDFVAIKFNKKTSEKNMIIDYDSDLDEQIKLIYEHLEKIELEFSEFIDQQMAETNKELNLFDSNQSFKLKMPKKYVFVVERKIEEMIVKREDYHSFMEKYGNAQ